MFRPSRLRIAGMILTWNIAFGASAAQPHATRADSHAPIGVMGDHTHDAGEVMFSYRLMFMDMDENRDGASRRGTSNVLKDYAVAPTEMSMLMHMFGVMYAPTDKLTLMAMLPYVRLNMDHVTRMGGAFTTSSESFGDTMLSALYVLKNWEHQRIHLNLGVSLPTGDFNERDRTPMGRVRLPYPMQIGSGTYDLLPGLTYNGRREDWSWGAQGVATLRFHQNRNDYQLGNRLESSLWLARSWCQEFSTSLRLNGQIWGNIHGADDNQNPALVPTADPKLRKGRRVDLGVGANWFFTGGPLKDHRLAVEFLVPVYQWLDGPQLEVDYRFIVGWQKAF